MTRMFKSLAASALLVFSTAAGAQTDAKPDLTGKWAFTVTYEGGSGSPTVTLTHKDTTLTGRYSSQVFGELDVQGSVKGRDFSFGFTTSAGGESFTMTFNGTMETADALKGLVDLGGMGSGTFTARRQKDGGDQLRSSTELHLDR